MIPGDFWEVTGIHLKDGGALAYANFLATDWRADQEFAKSKGWIKSYMVFSNNHARKGEPDLYLVVISERLPTGAEETSETTNHGVEEEDPGANAEGVGQPPRDPRDRQQFPAARAQLPEVSVTRCGR